MNNCIFCKIINGDLQADIVFEDEYTLGFRDINPQAPTHILIIPKIHITGLNNLDQDNLENMLYISNAAQIIADKENIIDKGYRWVINCGGDGGQTVSHLHLHLLH